MKIELERTFLLKNVPENLKDCKSVEIFDIYIPQSTPHPILRIRKKGDVLEITKKSPVDLNDCSEQSEETIPLTKEEFSDFLKLDGKRIRKIRYYYPINNKTAEIDVFLDDLEGLALVDVEFSSNEEKSSFIVPDFCLVDVTQEEFLAGGILAGKKYLDIQPILDKYGYKKLVV